MHERLDQWHYVYAALTIGALGMVVLVGLSLWAMQRAERRRDEVKKRK
ncbi:hypothetical protein [Novosphingobium sp. FKTRR1]|nr:hypothetical protein [Novosphingobium sp. FKTRR1]